ncbi:MAG TPA: hypothetical protein VN826_02770, partial [Candidatus Eisenbacteria bacterium]|nr:hypothetical protein [Candidatus Eisenbacteria bacterium]
ENVTLKDIQGRLINLKYSGGEIKVFVPPKIPIVRRVITDRTALINGAEVSVKPPRIRRAHVSPRRLRYE